MSNSKDRPSHQNYLGEDHVLSTSVEQGQNKKKYGNAISPKPTVKSESTCYDDSTVTCEVKPVNVKVVRSHQPKTMIDTSRLGGKFKIQLKDKIQFQVNLKIPTSDQRIITAEKTFCLKQTLDLRLKSTEDCQCTIEDCHLTSEEFPRSKECQNINKTWKMDQDKNSEIELTSQTGYRHPTISSRIRGTIISDYLKKINRDKRSPRYLMMANTRKRTPRNTVRVRLDRKKQLRSQELDKKLSCDTELNQQQRRNERYVPVTQRKDEISSARGVSMATTRQQMALPTTQYTTAANSNEISSTHGGSMANICRQSGFPTTQYTTAANTNSNKRMVTDRLKERLAANEPVYLTHHSSDSRVKNICNGLGKPVNCFGTTKLRPYNSCTVRPTCTDINSFDDSMVSKFGRKYHICNCSIKNAHTQNCAAGSISGNEQPGLTFPLYPNLADEMSDGECSNLSGRRETKENAAENIRSVTDSSFSKSPEIMADNNETQRISGFGCRFLKQNYLNYFKNRLSKM